MPKLFADLHNHPGFYTFNRLRNHPEEDDPSKFNPWFVPQDEDLGAMEKGERGRSYAQADVPKLLKSGTRLVFMSSCPIEKGFFWGHMNESGERHPFVLEAMKLMSGLTFLEGGVNLLRGDGKAALGAATRVLANRGPLRKFVQKVFMRYGMKRITFLASDAYDYWSEFLLEYEFFRSKSGVRQSGEVRWREDGVDKKESVTGRYQMIRSSDQLTSVIELSDDVGLILTIEGAYVFSIGPSGKPVSPELMFERIETLKTLEFPLFFITLAHHFDNGICGHAHSVPDAAGLVMDQTPRLNEGFERKGDLGLKVTRKLLGIDEDLNDLDERRIHIDCKHMSAQTRKEYYAEIIEPYNEKHPKRPIPVIVSHGAYSGVATLDELIAAAPNESDNHHSPPFYAWNINLADEDVTMVWKSKGLIGLVFDQRVCGVPPRASVPDDMWADVVMRQIFALVDVVMADDRLKASQKASIWDCICIGSDFDGMIDPLSRYATVLDFDLFEEDLRKVLQRYAHTRMIEKIGVDKLVEKIAWKNAYEFALRNFPS
ncbi:hypothetical protein FRD01_05175 [Microvenator marinus]|uniref:Membrane dipeptidase (Peptidase family M19) n=1 Tax=Microvenator marinus TaxID=2600177 RepID=A0A5B8XNF1_9DELT|nr:hypothetical protein [Microvenator marinus]QED26647.1 hypothetical protein FRD01_05175 [Microvenator marinus]